MRSTIAADIKLFRLRDDRVEEIPSSSVAVEKSLQTLIERHLEAFLGVRFLASEYSTTKSYGGRIDTLGIDETNSPVIVEFKRALNENVINQGLFYLNWLMDHRADFKLLVMEKLGAAVAGKIEWRYPRLVCIAGDFTRYDEHAIRQIPQNIDLIRYRRYGDDLILLEQIARNSMAPEARGGVPAATEQRSGNPDEPAPEATPLVMLRFSQCSPEVQDWFQTLRNCVLNLGEGVEERTVDQYIAFRHLKNFAYFYFRPTLNRIVIDLPLRPRSVAIEPGFTRKMKGNWIRVDVTSEADVLRVQPLLLWAFQEA